VERVGLWKLVLAARGLRMFGYGLLSVVLPIHLTEAGLSPAQIGLLFTVALAGGAAFGALLPSLADRWGRRRVLVACAGLMAISGAVLAQAPEFPLLLVVAALGLVSPTGQEVGAFQPLEQAILAEDSGQATDVRPYAWYDFTGFLAGAAGGLAAGLAPQAFRTALDPAEALVWAFAGTGALLVGIYALLPPSGPLVQTGSRASGLHRSRGLVLRLTALFGLDALAGGLVVQGLVALWFHQRFGLLPTMVGTHLPSNVLLALVPFMPSWQAAALLLLARHILSQMDVPVRRAYTMALVAPHERAEAAGLTNAVRNLAAAIAPVFSGIALQTAAPGLPFVLAGALKSAYDLVLWFMFRRIPLRA
jgi:MFS family permease